MMKYTIVGGAGVEPAYRYSASAFRRVAYSPRPCEATLPKWGTYPPFTSKKYKQCGVSFTPTLKS